MRFLPVQEPTSTWAVFDTTVDVPADYAGICLIGLTRARAEWFAARANRDASASVFTRIVCRGDIDQISDTFPPACRSSRPARSSSSSTMKTWAGCRPV
ncbi:hypothetical protein C9427_02595 [Mesorhizobium helmanticense]|uniref:Uncharacterized protein n=1 Tax=Mesorhizobium helmanticense TaxID=1776423 RepID=A0A2T4J215_9HYPH|nr:hypothetical protein C9427_02595 [Mesorhizobium helmanticense]